MTAIGERCGYVVLTVTHGRWKDDWDGEVHETLAAGGAALREATAVCGDQCVLVECIAVSAADATRAAVGSPEATRP